MKNNAPPDNSSPDRTHSQTTDDHPTTIKHAGTEWNYERNLLHALMDKSNDAIYFKDCESRFICCSNAQASMFNVPDVRELVGKRDSDYFTSEHALTAFEDEQAIIRTGKPIVGKMEKETWPDGHVTWA